MFCPSCLFPNPPGTKECQHCQKEVSSLRERVSFGAQFVFLDASPRRPLALSLDGGEPQVFTRPALISRHRHGIGLGETYVQASRRGQKPPPPGVDLPRLPAPTGPHLAAVVTERKIYRPKEQARVFIWCGGEEGVDITARVAHRLLGLSETPFEDAFDMRARAVKALAERGYKNNQLLPLGREFRAPLDTVADAVALYFHGDGYRDRALDFLRRTVERLEDGTVRWPTSQRHYWGGQLEATCDAARVMLDAGDALFLPAFRYVTGKLVNGMLYSTADTRALVELLAGLGPLGGTGDTALIDGYQVPLGEVAVGKEVTAQTDNLIVRVDEQIEIDHLEPRADFRFDVHPSKKRLRLGERIQIRVIPRESSIAPLVRLYLPGCLALLKGGANAQTAHLPVERDELVVDVVAVRSGRGKLYVTVHDMYDADKIGTAPGIEIQVE